MNDKAIGFRFPVPRREILEQIPEELHKLYGAQENPDPEFVSDEIDYVYDIKRPDGSPFKALLYGEYVLPGSELQVAFVVGDLTELEGVPVEVVDYEDDIQPGGLNHPAPYHYWRVTVRMPKESKHGRP